MTKDEALNLAIDALQKNIWCDDDCNCSNRQAITAIKEASPQRTWVGLTDDERIDLMYESGGNEIVAIQITEAKLKEKNT